MPYRVVRGRPITIPEFRAESFVVGDLIPDEAFEVARNGRLRRALLGLKRIEETGASAPEVDDTALEHVGGPWFLTPDGKKHRGKKAALAHMGVE